MLEQVYELSNLPALEDILRSDFTGFVDPPGNYNYLSDSVEDIIRSEMKNFLGYKWSTYRYFKKSLISGSIHSDLVDHNKYTSECVWGINWVFGGDGIIEFWNIPNVTYVGVTSGALNNPQSGIAPKFETTKKADYVYQTLKNKIYLINASLPHRASGKKNRSVFSLRTDDQTIPWETIVKQFDQYIIK